MESSSEDSQKSKSIIGLAKQKIKERRLKANKERKDLTHQVDLYSIGPFFTRKKTNRDKNPEVLEDFEIVNLAPKVKVPKIKDPKEEILKLSSKVQPDLKDKTHKLRIVVANLQSKVAPNMDRIKELTFSLHPPDVMAFHEVPKNHNIHLPDYRTFVDIDGQKSLNILTHREIGKDLNVIKSAKLPTIKLKNHVIQVIHTLKDPPQHTDIPFPNENTVIGDFNLPSNPQNIAICKQYKWTYFEPRGDCGICSTLPCKVDFLAIHSDHMMLDIYLDIQKPPPTSLVSKEYLDNIMETSLRKEELPHLAVNYRKARHPARIHAGYRHLWQLKTYQIRPSNSKFISFSLLESEIQEQAKTLFKGSYKPKKTTLDEKDEDILRILLRAFFLIPPIMHKHSKARDFTGFSYNKLIDLMYEQQDTKRWARILRKIWNRMDYAWTRVISLKKKSVVKSIHDIRFICVIDSFWKLYEEICKPLVLIPRLVTSQFMPGQMGFQVKTSCFDVLNLMFDKKLAAPPKMKLQTLIPDYTLWEPGWKD
jgi:hypothetical protein